MALDFTASFNVCKKGVFRPLDINNTSHVTPKQESIVQVSQVHESDEYSPEPVRLPKIVLKHWPHENGIYLL